MSKFIKLPSGLIVPRSGLTRRKLLAGLGAAIIVPKPAEAGFLLNSFKSTLNLIQISFLGNFSDATTHTTATFSACDYGAAASDRYIIVAAARGGSAAHTLVSASLNGIAASVSATQGANVSGTGIAIALVPSGTTGLSTIVTWSGSGAGTGIALYRLVGGGTITFDDSAMTTLDATNIPADVKRGGAAVFVDARRTGGVAAETGFTLDVENVVTAGAGKFYAGHYQAGDIADQTDRAFSIDSGGDRINTLVATFKPSL